MELLLDCSLQPPQPLDITTYGIESEQSLLATQLIRVYQTYACSLSEDEQTHFHTMLRTRQYVCRDKDWQKSYQRHGLYRELYSQQGGHWIRDKITFASWALFCLLYTPQDLAELATVVKVLRLQRRPCFDSYKSWHATTLQALELPDAASMAATWFAPVHFSPASRTETLEAIVARGNIAEAALPRRSSIVLEEILSSSNIETSCKESAHNFVVTKEMPRQKAISTADKGCSALVQQVVMANNEFRRDRSQDALNKDATGCRAHKDASKSHFQEMLRKRQSSTDYLFILAQPSKRRCGEVKLGPAAMDDDDRRDDRRVATELSIPDSFREVMRDWLKDSLEEQRHEFLALVAAQDATIAALHAKVEYQQAKVLGALRSLEARVDALQSDRGDGDDESIGRACEQQPAAGRPHVRQSLHALDRKVSSLEERLTSLKQQSDEKIQAVCEPLILTMLDEAIGYYIALSKASR